MKIIEYFIALCLFKASPADMPASSWLLKLSLLGYLIVGVFVGLTNADLTTSLFTSLADTLVLALFTWSVLSVKQLTIRFVQTYTALLGAGACIGLVAIPVLSLFYRTMVEEQPTSISMILMMALMFWSLMVMAHIFRMSLEIKPGLAAVITVIYTILSMLAVGLTTSGVA
jgi:hypothetical protein